jgi:hypothetical protein
MPLKFQSSMREGGHTLLRPHFNYTADLHKPRDMQFLCHERIMARNAFMSAKPDGHSQKNCFRNQEFNNHGANSTHFN